VMNNRCLYRLWWGCLASATSSKGSSMAVHAKPCHDSSYFWHHHRCTGTYSTWLSSFSLCNVTLIFIIMKLVQLRYAAGVKDMLDRHFRGEDFPEQNYIVKEGQLASQYRWSMNVVLETSIFKAKEWEK